MSKDIKGSVDVSIFHSGYWNPGPPGEVYEFAQHVRGGLATGPEFVSIVAYPLGILIDRVPM